MSIYKRNGVYQIEFQVRGRRVRESSGVTDRQAALDLERELKAQTQKAVYDRRLGRLPDHTFADAIDRWEKMGQAGAPKSMAGHIRLVRRSLGKVLLRDGVEAADQFARDMLELGLSPLTVNRRLAIVKRLLSLSWKSWGWLVDPLHLKVATYSEKGSQREAFLTPAQVKKLLDKIEHPVAKDALLIAVYTGLRRGELLRLKPDQVRDGVIYLTGKDTKSKKARAVPVHPAIKKIVEKRLPLKIAECTLTKYWYKAREEAGMPEIRWHDLRHTFGSWLALDPTVPVTEIRDLLGHSSLSVTNKYTHLRASATSVNRLPALEETPHKSPHTWEHVGAEEEEEVVVDQALIVEARTGIEPIWGELQSEKGR